MKFKAINAFRTYQISSIAQERMISPEKVIEMRWIQGDKWCQFYSAPGTSWKTLCKLARSAKQDFKKHLGAHNG